MEDEAGISRAWCRRLGREGRASSRPPFIVLSIGHIYCHSRNFKVIGSRVPRRRWMIGWLLFPPPASRHFIESGLLPGGRGGVAASGLALWRLSPQRQVSGGLQGRDGGARGPAGVLSVSGQDTGERRRRRPPSERGLGPLGSPPPSDRRARSRLTPGGLCGVAVRCPEGASLVVRADRALNDPRFTVRVPALARAHLGYCHRSCP